MEMRGERFSGSFELTGTAKMIGKLVSCVDTVLGVKDLPKTSPGAPTTSAEAGNESQPPSGPGREGGATNKSIYTGTGIVVTANGDVLTNNHVVKDCPNSIAVRRQDNTPTSAEVLFKDPENDLALLKISIEHPLENTQVATIRLSPAIRAGEAIAVYGYPLAGTLSTSGNIVPGNVSALSGMGDEARYFQITAPIQAGNSGGPLLDMTGSVAGVVNSKLDEMKFSAEAGTFPQNVNFAIKANIATNFLDAHSIPYKVAPQDTAALELPGVADKARNFTVLIVCD